MKNKKLLTDISRGGSIAAIYAVVTLLISPIAFGPLQCRVSEALTVLPTICGASVWGLTLGCAISNFAALMMGNTVAGVWDVLFGTLATALAAVCSRLTRNICFKGLPLLATVFPVVFNAVIVGGELTIAQVGHLAPAIFAYNALCVGAGQAVACIGGGLLLYKPLKKALG